MHVKGYPNRLRLIESELVPSEETAIYIFLVADTSNTSYYYRIMMNGDEISDYKVSLFEIQYRPYPQSPLRKPIQ